MTTRDRKSTLTTVLKHEILTLARPPGADLDEVALSEAFELSRTPVREVLRELDGLGFVQMRAGRGPRVAELSHVTLRSFFLAAPMIYGAVLRLAARNGQPGALVALKAAQDTFRDTLESGSVAERTLANHRFHEVTGEMADNLYLLPSFQRLLIDHARIGMTFYNPERADGPEEMATACAQHDAIIEAIAARDEAAAAQLAEDHWALSRDQIGAFLMPDGLDAPLGDALLRKTG